MAKSTEQLMFMPSTSTPTETANIREVPKLNTGDFHLGKVIGRGAYGAVHQGVSWGMAVAIKRFDNFDEEKSFDIEVEQLSRVNNEYIIQLFATSVDDEYKYIIMEYTDGGSLHNFLHCDFKPIYTKKQGLQWASQCAEGVAYLHQMKLLHRDLKPANLLLTGDYESVKICDFGTVAELKSTMTGERGTASYMAPEVFTGTKYNEKCDVYSFGILFWEIVSRQIPFKEFEANLAILYLKAQKGLRPPILKDCPPWVTKLMKSCWHKVPEKRPTMENVISTIDSNLYSYYREGNMIRYLFPSIPYVDMRQVKMLELIDLELECLVCTAKFSGKKKTIICIPSYRVSKLLIWIQQNLHLKHKNILSILGFAEDLLTDHEAAVLDCADLIPLRKFLHGNVKLQYSREHALSWAHQYANGMEYLHNIRPKPFLRCALITRNLFLTLGGLQLKIGDLEAFRRNPTHNRTIAYDAPEVCERFPPNEKSAVYSWGIVLWEVLTRKKPFDGYDSQEIIKQIIAGVHPAVEKDWPEPVKVLMKTCWEKEPKARPTMESVARQMATFDKDPLTPIVSTIDLQRIQNSVAVVDDEDFDDETRYKMSRLGNLKCILPMWKDQKVIIIRTICTHTSWHGILPSPFQKTHPNIISILAITCNRTFAVLEYSEDGPLDKFLHYVVKTEYTIDHALSWVQQLAEGCAYLLTSGFRNRTYTPSDLLLSNKCRTLKIIPLKLPFFGFSNSRKEVLAAYQAPEYCENDAIHEKLTVYNWAIVVWETLARRKPFEGYSVERIKRETKDGDRPPIRDDWPESIKVLIEKCWDSNPENRPEMQKVANAMKEIMVDFPRAQEPIKYEIDWNNLNSDPEE